MTTEPDKRLVNYFSLFTTCWVVLLVLALYPLVTDPAGPVKNLVTSLAAVPLALGWLWGTWRGRWSAQPGVALCLLFIVAALTRNVPWLPVLIIAVSIRPLMQEECFRARLIAALLLAAGVASVYGFVQALGLDPFPWSLTDHAEYFGLPATYGNPNFAGHVMGPLILLGMGYLASRNAPNRFVQYAACAALLLMVVHLYWTGMRAAPLAMAAGVGTVLLYAALNMFIRRPRVTARILVTGAVACALGGLFAFGAYVSARPDFMPPIDSAWILRLHGYLGAAEMLRDNPWLSFEDYAARVPKYWSDFEQLWFSLYHKYNDHVHNDYLEIAVNGGLPGVFVFFLALLYAVPQGLARMGALRGRAVLLQAGMMAALVATLVDALFGFPWHLPVSFALFVLLLLWVQPEAPAPAKRRWLLMPVPLIVLAASGWCVYEASRNLVFEQRLFAANSAQEYAGETKDSGAQRMSLLHAEATYQDALRIHPKSSVALRNLGRVSLALGQPDRAVELLERAYVDDHPATATALAVAYREQAKTSEDPLTKSMALQMAEFTANEALRLNAYLPMPYEVLGDLAAAREDWAVAADDYVQAARYSNETNVPRLSAAAEASINAGRIEEARSLLGIAEWAELRSFPLLALRRQVGYENPDNLRASFFLYCYMSDGTDSAWLAALGGYLREVYAGTGESLVEDFKTALTLNPDFLNLWHLLDDVLGDEGRTEEFNALLAEAPDCTAVALLRNVAAAATGTPEEREHMALAIAQLADSSTPEANDASWLAGRLWVPGQENTPETRATLAGLFARAANWDAVVALTDDLAVDAPANLLGHRARALLALGRADEALAVVRRAVAASPTPDMRLLLGEALAATGKSSEASFILEGVVGETRVGTPLHTEATDALEALENAP